MHLEQCAMLVASTSLLDSYFGLGCRFYIVGAYHPHYLKLKS